MSTVNFILTQMLLHFKSFFAACRRLLFLRSGFFQQKFIAAARKNRPQVFSPRPLAIYIDICYNQRSFLPKNNRKGVKNLV